MAEIVVWLPAAAIVALGFMGFVFRTALRSWVTDGVRHSFDRKLEILRSELSEQEETLKSDLRAKEEKITALRQIALSGATSRRETLDKRRLEAIDKIWESVVSLGSLKFASKYMESVNFEEAAKLAPTDANVRKLFEIIGKPLDPKNIPTIRAAAERPYISDRAWALFSAYQAILFYAVVQIKTLEIGVTNLAKLLNNKNLEDLVRVALPHQMPLLEQHGTSACHFLVDELEQSILDELKRNLSDAAASEEDIKVAARILSASEGIMANLSKVQAETSKN